MVSQQMLTTVGMVDFMRLGAPKRLSRLSWRTRTIILAATP